MCMLWIIYPKSNNNWYLNLYLPTMTSVNARQNDAEIEPYTVCEQAVSLPTNL